MHGPVPQFKGKPLTADLLRSRREIRIDGLSAIRDLFEGMCERLMACLEEFTGKSARFSLENIAEDEWRNYKPPGLPAVFSSERGLIPVELEADRCLARELCDVALGGSGSDAPSDADDRPLSNIENTIRRRFFELLLPKIAEKLSEIAGIAVAIQPPENNLPVPITSSGATVVGRFLVSAFGYGGELRLSFDKTTLLSALGLPTSAINSQPTNLAESEAAALRHAIAMTRVELRATLEGGSVNVAAVMALQPGDVLPLHASALDAATISAEGIRIATATMVRARDRLALRIAEIAPQPPPDVSSPSVTA